jgi:hypothetical protein
MCHYKNAVAYYGMARRFAKVNAYEAESYRIAMRSSIRKYIKECYTLTDDDYLDVYLNVVSDVTGYHQPIAA